MSGIEGAMNEPTAVLFAPAEIERAIGVLIESRRTFEVRILEARRTGSQYPVTIAGYFDDPARVLSALQDLRLAGAGPGGFRQRFPPAGSTRVMLPRSVNSPRAFSVLSRERGFRISFPSVRRACCSACASFHAASQNGAMSSTSGKT